jgi:hypothetical protein
MPVWQADGNAVGPACARVGVIFTLSESGPISCLLQNGPRLAGYTCEKVAADEVELPRDKAFPATRYEELIRIG